MRTFSKSLCLIAISATASTANAGIIKFEAAYGESAALTAEAAFNTSTYDPIREDFEGFTGPGEDDGTDQGSWVEAASTFDSNGDSYFDTSVGRFTMTQQASNNNNGNIFPERLMIEDETTGEYGRNIENQWLDSNDADEVTWDIFTGNYNAFGFFLSDPNDQGASLILEFADGSVSDPFQLNSDLDDGNLAYVTLFSDIAFTSGSLVFNNGIGKNDGWGIDNVTLAKVPEPGTLALLGLGLVGLGAARRRKA